MSKISRRGFLRGTLNGAAVSVALPFLDVFLDGNGKAIAATGTPLPQRFMTGQLARKMRKAHRTHK